MPDDARATPTTVPSPEAQHSVGLRVIAVYKAVETLGLLLAAAAAFQLERERNLQHLLRWLEHLSLTDTSGLRWQLVDMLQKLGPGRFVAIGLVALGYAAIFATEGIGLWLRKHWAEWFTVIATGSLVPFELYEVYERFGWLKFAVLVANVVIVVYLARIAMQPHRRR
ncbi:DUF2127 domain-containing protein [Fulvimonas soli]|jgi:uncharacterized membrane protein (DUF2068 family)|uniref:Uncharacterized membrane protein (DUF2068 family) n=1 Tax=Fulvimonas soli TaxID=155197 RepID=A0A316I885_9GAMM|nr:DUF2127 domain-containing protein [Fulvimonas soli]PWK88669.1 uncharacterized membrane protein (DUF2068 family) [Fulvimonas soli]TNY26801.1 hypothetical protein BV497_06835 [Fulvimonas soli]